MQVMIPIALGYLAILILVVAVCSCARRAEPD
jgi:hypothetical protein